MHLREQIALASIKVRLMFSVDNVYAYFLSSAQRLYCFMLL